MSQTVILSSDFARTEAAVTPAILDGAGAGAQIGAILGAAAGLLASTGVVSLQVVDPALPGMWFLAPALGGVAGAMFFGVLGGLIAATRH